MANPGKRPFWLHQLAEYLIGIVFVAQGLQSPTPLVPAVLGGLVVLNAACAKGSMSAFRIFGRRTHRFIDGVLIVLIIVAVVQPYVSVDNSTRLIMAVLVFVLALVWIQSDFTESSREQRAEARRAAAQARPEHEPAGQPAPRAATTSSPDGSTADTIGRAAGRLAGKGVNMYRARKQPKKE